MAVLRPSPKLRAARCDHCAAVPARAWSLLARRRHRFPAVRPRCTEFSIQLPTSLQLRLRLAIVRSSACQALARSPLSVAPSRRTSCAIFSRGVVFFFGGTSTATHHVVHGAAPPGTESDASTSSDRGATSCSAAMAYSPSVPLFCAVVVFAGEIARTLTVSLSTGGSLVPVLVRCRVRARSPGSIQSLLS